MNCFSPKMPFLQFLHVVVCSCSEALLCRILFLSWMCYILAHTAQGQRLFPGFSITNGNAVAFLCVSPATRSGASSGQCRGWDGWVVGDAQPQLYSLMPGCFLRWQLCSFSPKNQFLALLVLCVVSVLCFIIFLPWWPMSTPTSGV